MRIDLYRDPFDGLRFRVCKNTGESIQRAILYHDDGYISKEGIDISSLLFASNEGIIPSDIVGASNGIFIVEVDGEEYVSVVLDTYYDCVIKKLMNWEFEDCKKKVDRCKTECDDFSIYSYLLMSGIEMAVSQNMITEAIHLMGQLRELCQDCTEQDKSNSSLSGCGCNGA